MSELNTASPKISLRKKTFAILEDSNTVTRVSKLINYFLIVLIFTNVAAAVLESEKAFHQAYFSYLLVFEISSLFLFIVEYFARVWCCVEAPNPRNLSNKKIRLKYCLTPVSLIDLAAILPVIIALFIQVDLRVLRLFRVLRLLKLTHYFKGFHLFITVLGKEIKTMFATLMLMVFLTIIAASLMHAFEGDVQPEEFGSILRSFWWSVVTMTTVGYGDVVPATVSGKVIATFIMLIGVGLVAIPAGMLAARFTEELRERKVVLDNQVLEMINSGEISDEHYHTLEQVADKLDIETEELIRTIKFVKVTQKQILCQNCGKKIEL